jgi:small subunit ribosomal protein S1
MTDNVNPDLENEHDDFEALVENYLSQDLHKEGDVCNGTITEIGREYVMVDIGFKTEGQVPKNDFIGADGELHIEIGGIVEVYVELLENDDGLIDLSKDKAEKLKIWSVVEKAFDEGEPIEGTIAGKVKGGLTVDIGVKAFLPGSQVDLRPVKNLESFIGKLMNFKVIKFNRRRGNIVLSRRVLLEKQREKMRTETITRLVDGAVVEGIVKNITEYGCFIDLGGIDGLLHITDMSWGRVNHPSEMFHVGDEIKVMVLKFDQERERVSLGLKQISEDPWKRVAEKFRVSQRINGRVVSLADYGAFVELEDGIEGLVHISEMSWTRRIKHPSKMVSIGDRVDAMIIDIDIDNKKISLGMKQVEENPWEALKKKYPTGSRLTAKVKNITNFGVFLGVEEGIDGLVHISDLSWNPRIKNPSELFEVGDDVEAVVLQIDPNKEKFTLGIKQLTADPFETHRKRYPTGSIVEVNILKVSDFGVVVELEDEVQGVILNAELPRDKDERAAVKEGEKTKAKIVEYIYQDRKVMLSIRKLYEDDERKTTTDSTRKSTPQRITKLGDLLREAMDRGVVTGDPVAPPVAPGQTPETAPVEEAKAEETTTEAAPVEEAKAEETTTEDAPVEEAKAEETTTEDAPVEEAKAEEAPVEEAKAEETTTEDAPVEEAKAEETKTDDAPAEDPKTEA